MKKFLNKFIVYSKEIMLALLIGVGIWTKFRLVIDTIIFHVSNKKVLKTNSLPNQYLIYLNGIRHEIYLRRSTGDIFVFYEIFLDNCYFIPSNWLLNVKNIVDLGANIGMTALYYKYFLYPEAQCICVEASRENSKTLKENTKYSTSIQIIDGAIHSTSGWVHFDDQQAAWGGTITENHDAVKVRSYSMVELIENYNIETIDLLKIDIEGGEATLLSENNEWLKKVRFIIIELHHPYLSIEQLKNLLIPYGFVVISCAPKYKVKMVCAFVPERVNIDLNDPAIKAYIV